MDFKNIISNKKYFSLEIVIIIISCFLPLLFDVPFRFNVFLAWDGAYRLSLGQIPYQDFGLPLGIGFWILPAIYFKLFGNNIFNLIIIQSFINLLSLLTLRAILNIFKIEKWLSLSCILIFSLSFVLANFWPWYNHSVFVFELIGFYFILSAIIKNTRVVLKILFGSFFIILSIFTKQDSGVLGLFIAFSFILTNGIIEKNLKLLLYFLTFTIGWGFVFILPFYQNGMSYWFNYGQFPHYSRITIMDFLDEIMGASSYIKLYLLAFAILFYKTVKEQKKLTTTKYLIFALLCVGILMQSIIIQVTSYTPINGNIYFHTFAFAFIFSHFNLEQKFQASFIFKTTCIILIIFWWSGEFWNRHIRYKVENIFQIGDDNKSANQVSKKNYILSNIKAENKRSNWIKSDLKTFDRVLLPEESVLGIKKIKNIISYQPNNYKILNMSELTMLAAILPYEPEKGVPLWYHKNVAIFDKEIQFYLNRLKNHYYDVVIFQTIPDLNNFYPPEIRIQLLKNYKLKEKFLAPRIDQNSFIEVYLKN